MTNALDFQPGTRTRVPTDSGQTNPIPIDARFKDHDMSSSIAFQPDPVLAPFAPDSSPGQPPGSGSPPRLGAGTEIDEPDESLAARTPVARCADGNGTLTALFFSDHVADIARAKAMCALCPLKIGCLASAIDREEPWGVWGGELLSGGRIVANKRPCGRPPKQPRPEVVYDEMGPVGLDLTA